MVTTPEAIKLRLYLNFCLFDFNMLSLFDVMLKEYVIEVENVFPIVNINSHTIGKFAHFESLLFFI